MDSYIYLIFFLLLILFIGLIINTVFIIKLHRRMTKFESSDWNMLSAQVRSVINDGKHLLSMAQQIGYLNNELDALRDKKKGK